MITSLVITSVIQSLPYSKQQAFKPKPPLIIRRVLRTNLNFSSSKKSSIVNSLGTVQMDFPSVESFCQTKFRKDFASLTFEQQLEVNRQYLQESPPKKGITYSIKSCRQFS